MYNEILDKVKKKLKNNNIVFTTSPNRLIIDDIKLKTCLLDVYNYYNGPYILRGSMQDTGITCKDLEDLGILSPIFKTKSYELKEI